MLYNHISQLIGKTPLLEPERWNQRRGNQAKVLCKLEGFNPAGSSKDRVALAMIKRAQEDGTLQNGATIIEPTSGNTGIGLAALAAAEGYRMILTMPDSMSAERIRLLQAYGAEVVLTPGADGMTGAIAKARELAEAIPNSWITSQKKPSLPVPEVSYSLLCAPPSSVFPQLHSGCCIYLRTRLSFLFFTSGEAS